MSLLVPIAVLVVVLLGVLVDRALEQNRDLPAADQWGPDADKPIDLTLTDRGRVAADLPGVFVLNEADETWGPA